MFIVEVSGRKDGGPYSLEKQPDNLHALARVLQRAQSPRMEPDLEELGSGLEADGGGQRTEVGHPYDGKGGVQHGVERKIQREVDDDEGDDKDRAGSTGPMPYEPPD